MSVSVILVNYNTQDYTVKCIKSIYNNTVDVDFEIILVDNNSDDDSVDTITKKYPEVIIIRNPENFGFGRANNVGILYSKKKYVLLLNTDTELTGNNIYEFWTAAEYYRKSNPNLLCMGGCIVYPDFSPQNSYGNFPTIKASLWNFLWLNKLMKKYYLKNLVNGKPCDLIEPTEVPHIIGVAMFMYREQLLDVGLFDEDFFLYFEETELCYRIKEKGFNIMLFPNIKIIHHLSKSMRSNQRKNIHLERSRILYFEKTNFSFISLIKLISVMSFLRYAIINKDIRYIKAIKEIL